MSSSLGNSASNFESCPDPNTSTTTTSSSSYLKPCCACPETRKMRDECVFLKGEDGCIEYIEKHRECLKSFGFLL